MSSGIIFDIDGVLRRGSAPIQRARDAFDEWKYACVMVMIACVIANIMLMHRTQGFSLPHVFVTNGGGMHESEKAAHVTDYINYPVCNVTNIYHIIGTCG